MVSLFLKHPYSWPAACLVIGMFILRFTKAFFKRSRFIVHFHIKIQIEAYIYTQGTTDKPYYTNTHKSVLSVGVKFILSRNYCKQRLDNPALLSELLLKYKLTKNILRRRDCTLASATSSLLYLSHDSSTSQQHHNALFVLFEVCGVCLFFP